MNFENPKISRGLSSSDIRHNFVASYVWAIPIDRAFPNAPKRLTQGWQMQGITRFSTGFPIQMNQGNGDASLAGSSATDMPNLVGPVVTVNPRKSNPGCPTADGTGCYFLPSAFAVNTVLRHVWYRQPALLPRSWLQQHRFWILEADANSRELCV